jgi:tRNA pseudouridine65 synthase
MTAAPEATGPSILYRDEDLFVVDKPSGMIVHRGWANDDDNLLRAVRRLSGRKSFPVHRLDRGASGIVVFALSREAASTLGRAFAEARVQKRYLALTRGHPPAEGRIDHALKNRPEGKAAVATTLFRKLGTAGRYALVCVEPRTGRLHQIRRHMKHIACPLIGDIRYGKGEHNRFFRDRYALHRLALHAVVLNFLHPTTGRPVSIHCPVSGSFRECLNELGLLAAADGEASAGATQIG